MKASAKHLVVGLSAGIVMAFPSAAFAGGGLTGGATLPQQIIQEITAVAQLAKQASMVTSQLQMVYNQIYNLRQLNPAAIAQLVGVPVTDIQNVLNLMNAVQQVQDSYTGLAGQIQNFQYGSQQMNMTPRQYLQFQAQAAAERGGVFKQVYEQQTQAIRNLQRASDNLKEQAASIPGITSQIGGLQNLMNQNVQLQAQMISVNQVLRQQLQLEAMKAQKDAAGDAAAANGKSQASAQSAQQYSQLQKILKQTQSTYGGMTLPSPQAYNPAGGAKP
jgi:P-type conjugative transfer protein TrbJ